MLRDRTTRRRAIAGGLAAATILRWPANAAEFNFKFGAASPMEHPALARSKEAADRIRQASNGQLDITVYPSSQLGSDTAMISQVISGAIQMFLGAADVLSTRNPVCGISGIGFAFANYQQVWAALDGDLGRTIRGLMGDMGLHVLDQAYDHGYRQITSRIKPIVTPDDLRGMKLRLPPAPYMISLFRHLGASPTAMNFGEVYSALQTGLMDGQENPLVLIDAGKLYEVQKYCSLTNHVWAGLYVVVNKAAWTKLPPHLRDLMQKEFTAAVTQERQDFLTMTHAEQQSLTAKGMVFNTVDTAPFREVLAKSGYYPDMKRAAGDKIWGQLEKYVGPLVA